MRNWAVTCATLTAFAVPFLAGPASAATIEYIFSGTASWTLGGVDFADAPFTLTYVADTTNITSGGGEFTNTGVGTFVSGATTVHMTGDVDDVIIFGASDTMGFGQVVFSPFNVADEAIVNSAFGGGYNLSTAFPLTTGFLNPPTAATYSTDGGALVFTDASFGSVSFEAIGGVPEPSTWAMMLLGFAGLGFAGYRQRRVLVGAASV
jgi:hypothetical protein